MWKVMGVLGGLFTAGATTLRLLEPHLGPLAESVSLAMVGLGLWATSRIVELRRPTSSHLAAVAHPLDPSSH